MKLQLTLLVLRGVLMAAASAQSRQYFLISTPLNWTEAQSFCRERHTDLATIETAAEIDVIDSISVNYTGKAWIGLSDVGNVWRWSLKDSSYYADGEAEFRNWCPGCLNNSGGRDCVALLGNLSGSWANIDCSTPRGVVCYNGTVNGTLVFVNFNFNSSWTEAQRFCRENYVDLASVRNKVENDIIRNISDGCDVWIGLHREKVWSDGSALLFENWDFNQPDSGYEECVTISLSDSGRWSDDNCSLVFPFICYETFPPNANCFRSTGKNESSITLQWNQVSGNVSFLLQFDGTETNITSPDGDRPVFYTVSPLTAATKYTFTLYSVFEDSRSSGVSLTAVTAPANVEYLRSSGHYETSIILQWSHVNNNVSLLLLLDGREVTNVFPPDRGGVIYYGTGVGGLTPGMEYTFTLFSVFEGIRSSGVRVTAVTAPANARNFRSTGQNESSITLQWDQVSDNVSFIIQFNGTETNITAPDGDGPVFHKVSPLTAGTQYNFTLFSVFKNIRSSGITLTAATAHGPYHVVGLNIRLHSSILLSDVDIQLMLEELFSPAKVWSVQVKSIK